MAEKTNMLRIEEHLSLFIIDKSGNMPEPPHPINKEDIKEISKLYTRPRRRSRIICVPGKYC